MTRHPVSPPCPACHRPTQVLRDGTVKRHRERQDPAAPWCPQSGRAA